MGHYAFIAPPFAGHFNPMQAVAGELVARGHRASFVQQEDAADFIRAPGVGFIPVGRQSHPRGELGRMIGRINRTSGLLGMGPVLRDLARGTDMLCREAPRLLREHGVTGIVADQTEAAGGLVARHLGLPYVSVANALPINGEPGVPPPFTGWLYDPTPWGRQRNRGGYRVARLMMWRMRRVIGRYAALWRLGRLRTMEDCLSPRAQISQMVQALDFPRQELPARFHYSGPLREQGREPPLPEPIARAERPLVFVTLGTLQGNRLEVFRSVAEACLRRDLQCVIAHAGRLSAEQAASLPGHPLVFDFVPQRALIRRAAAVVTHGGMNTVLDALSFGVPMLAIPLAFEQAAIAARIRHAGAGETVPAHALDGRALARSLDDLLAAPSYRSNAARLQQAIAEAGGVKLAADVIESCCFDPM